MAGVSALDQYRRYLAVIDRESARLPSDDLEAYLELLGPGEALDLLVIRDEIAQLDLTPEERCELDVLDDLLVKHRRLIAENLWPHPAVARGRWWWHLDEGPEVRQRALAAGRLEERASS